MTLAIYIPLGPRLHPGVPGLLGGRRLPLQAPLYLVHAMPSTIHGLDWVQMRLPCTPLLWIALSHYRSRMRAPKIRGQICIGLVTVPGGGLPLALVAMLSPPLSCSCSFLFSLMPLQINFHPLFVILFLLYCCHWFSSTLFLLLLLLLLLFFLLLLLLFQFILIGSLLLLLLLGSLLATPS